MTPTMEGLGLPENARSLPICGIVVVAALAGVPFAEAWALMAKKHAPNWKGWSYESERTEALAHYGVRLERLYATRTTLNNLAKRLDPARRYIIRTSKHVQLVHNGHILDQGGWRPVTAKDWACRKYVTSILMVAE